jgi:succinate dehydrogenase / fumarate reductase membrane anchor subunit
MSLTTSSGLRTWLLQRLSAVYIAIFSLVLIGTWTGQSATYEVWRNWVAHPVVNIALILFILAILLHAWVGIRDIVMDYITSVYVRYVLLISFALVIIGMGFWVLRTLIMVTAV